VTLKVVGASPIIYLILSIKANVSTVRRIKKYVGSVESLRNPDFARAWSSRKDFDSASPRAGLPRRSRFLKLFTKRFNPAKLYAYASSGFFLSPGIVLRHYSDPEARHLKKKAKAWVYLLTAIKMVSDKPWVLDLGLLSGRKEFVLRKILQLKVPFS
jgi:hypothetical protein